MGIPKEAKMAHSNMKSNCLKIRKTESGHGPWISKDLLLRLNTQIYSLPQTLLFLEETRSDVYFLGFGYFTYFWDFLINARYLLFILQ